MSKAFCFPGIVTFCFAGRVQDQAPPVLQPTMHQDHEAIRDLYKARAFSTCVLFSALPLLQSNILSHLKQ